MLNVKSLLPLVLSLAVAACSSGKSDPLAGDAAAPKEAGPGADAGASASVACYVAVQDRCKEFPVASEEQRAGLEVECSSVSGVPSSPAACPTTGFVGKCTIAPSGKDGPEVRRFYRADDAAYQQDFCVNTAKGVWSATF